MPKGIYNHYKIRGISQPKSLEIREKISNTLKQKYKLGIIIPSMLGKKNPSCSEWNRIHKKGKNTWNKGIKVQEYLNHFKDIDLWRQNKCIGEQNKTIFQRAKPGIISTLKQSKSKVSKAELILKNYLEENNIKYIHQYPFKLGVADFYLPNKNLIVECYGSYWHSKPDYIVRDKNKNQWLEDNGYNILILNSEDIINCNDLHSYIGLL